LSANPKLIDSFRHWSRNPEICVVGFKLTDDPEPKSREAQVRGFRERGVADLVVHNDVREIAGERHVATIHDAHGRIIRTESKEQLANELWELISTQPSRA
jgi:phosphopantothenate-cysteine ligase